MEKKKKENRVHTLYTHTHIHTYVHTNIYIYIYIYIYVRVNVCVRLNICIFIRKVNVSFECKFSRQIHKINLDYVRNIVVVKVLYCLCLVPDKVSNFLSLSLSNISTPSNLSAYLSIWKGHRGELGSWIIFHLVSLTEKLSFYEK